MRHFLIPKKLKIVTDFDFTQNANRQNYIKMYLKGIFTPSNPLFWQHVKAGIQKLGIALPFKGKIDT
ncbi:MAG TPA: hypothetical protein DCY35_09205 [Prolixibacteraceae bacterium]|nr:hypothetical protein [Prolixibacteraceae bacterium]